MDRVGTLLYAANGYVPEGLLRRMVVSLSRIVRHCFPQVYAVIRDLESDSGLLPVPPMDFCDMSFSPIRTPNFTNLLITAGFRWQYFAFDHPDWRVGHLHTRQSCFTELKRAVQCPQGDRGLLYRRLWMGCKGAGQWDEFSHFNVASNWNRGAAIQGIPIPWG